MYDGGHNIHGMIYLSFHDCHCMFLLKDEIFSSLRVLIKCLLTFSMPYLKRHLDYVSVIFSVPPTPQPGQPAPITVSPETGTLSLHTQQVIIIIISSGTGNLSHLINGRK
jgi:hypothetical protein